MKKKTWVHWALVSATAVFANVVFAADPALYFGKVTRVVDGDTVQFTPKSANPGGQRERYLKVRMLNIDAPESHFPTEAGPVVGQEPWGGMATAELKALIGDSKDAELETFDTDKYGRALGRLQVRGVDVNLEMVRSGMVFPFIICDKSQCNEQYMRERKIGEYLAACEDARANGRGLFDSRKPLREEPYNFRLRMNKKKGYRLVGDFRSHRLYDYEEGQQVPVCSRVFFEEEHDAVVAGYFR